VLLMLGPDADRSRVTRHYGLICKAELSLFAQGCSVTSYRPAGRPRSRAPSWRSWRPGGCTYTGPPWQSTSSDFALGIVLPSASNASTSASRGGASGVLSAGLVLPCADRSDPAHSVSLVPCLPWHPISVGCALIISLIIRTILLDPSAAVWTDVASNLSRPDPSGADQIDAEHQATDLAVRGRIPRGAPKMQVIKQREAADGLSFSPN
jgi:hypothetical protein